MQWIKEENRRQHWGKGKWGPKALTGVDKDKAASESLQAIVAKKYKELTAADISHFLDVRLTAYFPSIYPTAPHAGTSSSKADAGIALPHDC